jgi:hypothetical protein
VAIDDLDRIAGEGLGLLHTAMVKEVHRAVVARCFVKVEVHLVTPGDVDDAPMNALLWIEAKLFNSSTPDAI